MKFIFPFLFCPLLSFTQQKGAQALSVGDYLSTKEYNHLKEIIEYPPLGVRDNSPSGVGGTSPLGGKGVGVILDFFGTWCAACIRELPKLDSLQKQFAGRLQIVLVAQESKEKLNGFRKKNALFAACQLPVVIDDGTLSSLFPHKYFPHTVWINAKGRVAAITESSSVTAANLLSFISGNGLSLAMKNDDLDFDYSKPLLQNGNGGTGELLLYRSVLAARMPGMGGTEGFVRDSLHVRYYYINSTILGLYRAAFGFASNRVILQVADTSSYILHPDATGEWKNKNLYTYELTVPVETSPLSLRRGVGGEALKKIIAADLDHYFNLHGRMEKRLVSCWALVHTQQNDSAINKASLITGKSSFTEQNENYILTNQPLSLLVDLLNAYNSPMPDKPIILDESQFSGNINMQIPMAAIGNIDWLQKILSPHGFHLVPVEREIEMFVLTDSNFHHEKPGQ